MTDAEGHDGRLADGTLAVLAGATPIADSRSRAMRCSSSRISAALW
jgi:hypothetical protein